MATLPEQLALVRALATRWLPPSGRRERKRVGIGLVLAIPASVSDNDPTMLAQVEIEFLVEEILRRGRREDGDRISRDDLRAAGLGID